MPRESAHDKAMHEMESLLDCEIAGIDAEITKTDAALKVLWARRTEKVGMKDKLASRLRGATPKTPRARKAKPQPQTIGDQIAQGG